MTFGFFFVNGKGGARRFNVSKINGLAGLSPTTLRGGAGLAASRREAGPLEKGTAPAVRVRGAGAFDSQSACAGPAH
ncbi:hypothetical protein chiPu_0009112 [Chiloscyllium punctatum]|uniref:Uncharacterized protein n=1 Tax=Chiloscyllium punctatum TaxID=137246 RepID=A0A401SJR3_CHIPU|nr:hypothetical protein [Chiloscyllium punctatum]